jgi:hypothetical protein
MAVCFLELADSEKYHIRGAHIPTPHVGARTIGRTAENILTNMGTNEEYK